MAQITDRRTPNLGLPLPYVENELASDCPRIAESLEKLDRAYGELRLVLAETSKKALDALASAEDLAMDVANASQAAAGAWADAATALGAASDAMSAARSALSAAQAASELAGNAKTTADSAIPRSGERGALSGYEVVGDIESPPIITIESPDCVNLETSGAIALSFTPAESTLRAVKAISITAAAATTLTISGAVWANNGEAPQWGDAGKILVLLAHFVGGRVVLSVADNTQ